MSLEKVSQTLLSALIPRPSNFTTSERLYHATRLTSRVLLDRSEENSLESAGDSSSAKSGLKGASKSSPVLNVTIAV